MKQDSSYNRFPSNPSYVNAQHKPPFIITITSHIITDHKEFPPFAYIITDHKEFPPFAYIITDHKELPPFAYIITDQ